MQALEAGSRAPVRWEFPGDGPQGHALWLAPLLYSSPAVTQTLTGLALASRSHSPEALASDSFPHRSGIMTEAPSWVVAIPK